MEILHQSELETGRGSRIGKPLVYTVKKVRGFPVPSRDVTYRTPPGQEEFVIDIPAGNGKPLTFYYSEYAQHLILVPKGRNIYSSIRLGVWLR